jgi:uncharacterized membrane protein YphA (DoxX/SURF4 family)
MIKKRIIPDVAGPLLIMLFAYAAASKLMIYSKFVVQIGQSPILAGVSPYLAWLIPAVELIICLLLLLPAWRLIGFFAATILMAVFTLYIVAILTLSPEVPCSCGGILDQMGWKSHLVFNIAFTGIALAGLLIEKRLRKNGDDNIGNQLNYQA